MQSSHSRKLGLRMTLLAIIGTGPWVALIAARPLVDLLLRTIELGVPLPVMRARSDFSATFYADLVRMRLLAPAILATGTSALVALLARDVDKHASMQIVDALRARLSTRNNWAAVSVLVVIAFAAQVSLFAISEKGNDYDAAQIVTQALIRASDSPEGVTPFRDPLSPVLLAVQLQLDPRLEGFTQELVEVDGPHQLPLKQHNVFVVSLGLLVLGALLRRTVADPVRALVAWIVTIVAAYRYFVPPLLDVNLSESHGFLILALTALSATLLVERPTVPRAIVLGLMLGLLSLTKGSFLLVVPIFVALLLMLLVLDRSAAISRAHSIAIGAVVAVAFLSAHAPFAVERASAGHGISPSNRGGLVLAIRAGYDNLEPADWRAIYAAGGPISIESWGVDPANLRLQSGPGSRTFWKSGSEFFATDREAYAAGRPDLTHSYYARGVASCVALSSNPDPDAPTCADWALSQFRENPTEFVLVTIARFWAGFWFVEDASILDVLINFLFMAAVHIIAVHSLLRGRATDFALSALPVGLLAFEALTTGPMNEPRRTLWMVALIVVAVLVPALRKRPEIQSEH